MAPEWLSATLIANFELILLFSEAFTADFEQMPVRWAIEKILSEY